jgi:hypothetical protein
METIRFSKQSKLMATEIAFSISNLEEELKNDPDNIGCFVGWVHSEQLNYLVYLGE